MFYLFEEQNGGCDYTIGCGFRLRLLEATTMEEAIMEVQPRYDDGYLVSGLRVLGEGAIDRARILEVVDEVEVNLTAIADRLLNEKRAAEEEYKLRQEQAEYHRLKQKFGE